ncbi:MAG TPA: flippase [Opitutus sp.]|nr:flippase [Opitutus sp.]
MLPGLMQEGSGVRAAARNFGWLAAERGVRLTCSVAGGLVVARYLGPAQFGVFNYALAMVTFLLAIAQMGLDALVQREVLATPERAAATLGAAGRLRLAAGAACYGAVLGWVWWGEADGEARRLLVIAGAMVFLPGLTVADLWLQANLQARRSALAQAMALVLGLAGRLWLVAARAPLWTFGAVVTAEALLAAGFLNVMAWRAGVRIARDRAAGLARRLAGEAWPLMLASIAVMIYLRIDVVMLQQLAGPAPAGIYAAAVRISEIGYFVPAAIASSVLPALLRSRAAGEAAYRERLQRYYDGSAALAYGLTVPVALAAPWVVRLLYGAAFADAGPVLALHVWASVFVFLGVARSQFLVNEKLTRFALLATSLGAAVNVGLNGLWIPRWGAMGAAWATLVSYALSAWASSFLHPAVRATGRMQTRALLLPLTGWRYLRRR